MSTLELATLQRWMQHLILDRAGPQAAARSGDGRLADLEDVVLESATLAPPERIEIYAGMVRLRFAEVLASDYPATRAALGEARWHALVPDYLAAHPSTHFSLNRLGARLPEFYTTWKGRGSDAPFLTELAWIERDVQAVFDEREFEVLPLEALRTIPPETWPALRLATIPALRLLALDHPTNAWLSAWRDGSAGAIPAPAPSWLAIYRSDDRVWRAPLTREQHRLLAELASGATLGAALDACVALPGADPEHVGRSVSGWFREWAAAGFFLALHGP